MLLYPYINSDVSPNALRSSYNPDRAYIGRNPQHGNSGHHPEITTGWCGTTNDSNVVALGEIDTNDINWLDQVEAVLPDEAKLDRAELAAWVANDDADDDYEVDQETLCTSHGFTWDESPDSNNYYPEPREGWTVLASYDAEDDIVDLDKTQRNALESATSTHSGVGAVEAVLDAAEIYYDSQTHDTYNSGSCGTDWAIIAVQDEDADQATNAIKAAVALLDVGYGWDTVAKMLRASSSVELKA